MVRRRSGTTLLVEAGAAAYLLKSAGRNELVAAINAAARADGSVLLALTRPTAIGLGRGPMQTRAGGLSAREFEVLCLVAEAKSNRDIARALIIASRARLARIMGCDAADAGDEAWSALARWFVSIFSFICILLGYLWMLWDGEKQCWHDKAARDVVVTT